MHSMITVFGTECVSSMDVGTSCTKPQIYWDTKKTVGDTRRLVDSDASQMIDFRVFLKSLVVLCMVRTRNVVLFSFDMS